MRPKWFQADPKSRYPPAEPVVSRRDLERARKSDNERQDASRQFQLEAEGNETEVGLWKGS